MPERKNCSAAPATSITRYDITGADTSDVLTIDYTAGDPIPAGGLAYDGGDRVNSVRVLGDGSTLDVSAGGDIELTRIDVVDLNVSDSVTLVVDSAAMRSIDPDGGGLLVTGGEKDNIQIDDAEAWQIGTPQVVAGFFFTRLETGNKFIQTDLPIAWHNYIEPSDINNDREVTAGDALRVINELILRRFSDADGLLDNPANFDPFPGVYFDQNGDGSVTAIDALRVINELARQQAGGEGEIGFVFVDNDPVEAPDAIMTRAEMLLFPVRSTNRVASFDLPSSPAPTPIPWKPIEDTRLSESVEAVDRVFAELVAI